MLECKVKKSEKIKEEILEYFENVKFLPGQDKHLVGYAEMFGTYCIPLYKNINFIPCKSSKDTISKMKKLNNKALYAYGYEDTFIGYLILEDNTKIYLHDKEKVINKIIKEFKADKTGLFKDDEDIETSANEHYEYNILGAYMEGIPAFAVLMK